jgi:hypothetical protein
MRASSLAAALVFLGISVAATAGTHREACARSCADQKQECLDEAYASARACLGRARNNDDVDACLADLRAAEDHCKRAALACATSCAHAEAAGHGP